MKKFYYYLFPLLLSGGIFTACNSDDDEILPPDAPENPNASVALGSTPRFPEKDKSTNLSYTNPQLAVNNLLKKTGPEIDRGFASFKITDAQYEEIKTFTDELVADASSQSATYSTIFKWIVNNVRYEWGDNDPYAVFKNRHAVCQGYANLLNVMLHTQGIPVVNINGMLEPLGGHAWNYVYYNRKWHVSDPTNNSQYAITSYDDYPHLVPLSIDMDIFPTEATVCKFTEKRFTLARVRQAEDMYTVPYSEGGIRITSFSPDSLLPENVREICLGINIESLGEEFIGLSHNAPNLEFVHVDAENTKLKSHCGVVYKKANSELVYIPSAMPVVELLPIEEMGKNYVYNVLGMETLIIAPGTKKLHAYAVENCPKLRVAYVPEDTEIDPKAFYSVHPDFQVIRGDLTCIPEITM